MKLSTAVVAAVMLLSGAEAVSRGRGGRSFGGSRSGGRAGGSFSRSKQPRRSATKTKEKEPETKTKQPDVVVVQQGGMGGGMGTALVGMSLLDSIMHEQRRAEMMRRQLETERQLGKNDADIENLKAQLAAQEAKVSGMQAQAAKEGNN
mmetsp:Transcript_900/g.2544  ORF Transcript_900/g.2544 Transcript_900/m.2544 type:complete len:149 (-) Transcript_900:255-701(-)